MDNQPNPTPSQVPEDSSFVKKPIDQPIFDAALREKITLNEMPKEKSPSFFKANKFYILAIITATQGLMNQLRVLTPIGVIIRILHARRKVLRVANIFTPINFKHIQRIL